MSQLLSIQHLNAYFGSHQVIFDLGFNLAVGQKLALVGESGSGKTVCAQAILQLNSAVALDGSVRFEGDELVGASERTLRKIRGREIGMIFQEPMTALNPVMSVGTQIMEVLQLHLGLDKREAREKSIELLLQTGIQEASNKVDAYPFELSGGQRQRVMIAMALAAQPKLLIADEPTTALDVAVQGQILSLLHDVQQKFGMAILYITHDLSLVKRFADDVVVMQKGCAVEKGSVSSIFSFPKHAYTQLLLNSQPEKLEGEVQKQPVVLDAHDLGVQVFRRAGWFKKIPISILHNTSFQLREGQTLGVIGESGSGKTTLIKALLRLIKVYTGQIQLEGLPWLSLSEKALRRERHKIQVVFQDPFSALNPRMSVLNIIAEGLRLHHPELSEEQVVQEVKAILSEVGLSEEVLYRYAHEFSGGQRQRIALARALILKPKILVMDEPTSALDVSLQKQVIALLLKLQEKYRISMLIVSHDLAVIQALAHYVVVLKDGGVVESGLAQQVFNNPNMDYTQKLLTFSKACNFSE